MTSLKTLSWNYEVIGNNHLVRTDVHEILICFSIEQSALLLCSEQDLFKLYLYLPGFYFSQEQTVKKLFSSYTEVILILNNWKPRYRELEILCCVH